jgi:hypothetical protein
VAVGRPTWDELDHRAIWRGTRAYLIIAVPFGVLSTVFNSAGLQAVAALLLLAGSTVGGAVAAATGRRAPLTQAAIAVAIPTVLYFFVVKILDAIIRGKLDAILIVSLALYLVVLVGLGILGGYLSFRRRTRTA